MALTEAAFWDLIELIDKDAVEKENPTALDQLKQALAGLSPRKIEDFEQRFHQALFEIDGQDYFDASGESSGDGFLYCRCYAVSRGREYYSRVLRHETPVPGRWFEPLLYVAAEAWGQKKNQDPEEWGFDSGIDYETGGNAARWPKRKEIVLSKAQIEEQKELEYQRAASRVVHFWRAGRHSQIVETLEPYEPRLSQKLRAILNDARTKAAAAAPHPEERGEDS